MRRTCIIVALCLLGCGCAGEPRETPLAGPPEGSFQELDAAVAALKQGVEVSVQLYGVTSGIDPASIHVVAGDRELPREKVNVTEVTDAAQKCGTDPAAPEYVATFDPVPFMNTPADPVYVFCADKAGHLSVARPLWNLDKSYKWEAVPTEQAQALHDRFFPPPPRFLEVAGPAELSVVGGQVVCLLSGKKEPYVVTGNLLEELEGLGLESVAKLEVKVEGTADQDQRAIDVRSYEVAKIVPPPKVRFIPAAGKALVFLADGKVMCDLEADEGPAYEVSGDRAAELRKLGLEGIGKVEMNIKGQVDLENKTLAIAEYKILKIIPSAK